MVVLFDLTNFLNFFLGVLRVINPRALLIEECHMRAFILIVLVRRDFDGICIGIDANMIQLSPTIDSKGIGIVD